MIPRAAIYDAYVAHVGSVWADHSRSMEPTAARM